MAVLRSHTMMGWCYPGFLRQDRLKASSHSLKVLRHRGIQLLPHGLALFVSLTCGGMGKQPGVADQLADV